MKVVRKSLIVILVLSMLVLAACSSNTGAAQDPEGPYKNGTYTGVGKGFGGDIEVEVVIEGGNIAELNVISHDETSGISDAAFDGIKEQLLEKQSAEEIDTVSSATGTSNGLIEAITKALEQAE